MNTTKENQEQIKAKVAEMFDVIKTSADLKGPVRQDTEDFDTYKLRRMVENYWAKQRLKPVTKWISVQLENYGNEERPLIQRTLVGGTYRKALHGDL